MCSSPDLEVLVWMSWEVVCAHYLAGLENSDKQLSNTSTLFSGVRDVKTKSWEFFIDTLTTIIFIIIITNDNKNKNTSNKYIAYIRYLQRFTGGSLFTESTN